MNLGNLITFARLFVPGAKSTRIDDSTLTILINEVARDVNARLGLLNQDSKFNVVDGQYKYDLTDDSETVSRFLRFAESGLWWNRGTSMSTDWVKLRPRTMKWLNDTFPQWRNADSGDPLYYAKDGKFLIIHPTPDTDLTSGFWLYFIENITNMDKHTDYPFGNYSEISEYSFLTNVILKGIEAWLNEPVGKDQEASQAFQEYLLLIEDARKILAQRPDIQSDPEAKIRIPRVC